MGQTELHNHVKGHFQRKTIITVEPNKTTIAPSPCRLPHVGKGRSLHPSLVICLKVDSSPVAYNQDSVMSRLSKLSLSVKSTMLSSLLRHDRAFGVTSEKTRNGGETRRQFGVWPGDCQTAVSRRTTGPFTMGWERRRVCTNVKLVTGNNARKAGRPIFNRDTPLRSRFLVGCRWEIH